MLVTVAPNRTLLMSSPSMAFVFSTPFSGGKLISGIDRASGSGQAFCSLPAVDGAPPERAKPLLVARFGPLPMRPPARSELLVVVGRRHRKRFSGELVPKDGESPARMKIRRDQQDSRTRNPRQAFLYIVGFVPGRQAHDWTNLHRCRLWKILRVSFGQLHLGEFEKLGVCWNIQQHPRRITLIQKLERARRPMICLAGQNHDYVGRPRIV